MLFIYNEVKIMKINSINSINYMSKEISFSHTAVPYPEYENAYYYHNNQSSINRAVDRISALFSPEVTQKSQFIKDNINKIYDKNIQQNSYNEPGKHLLSVLA